MKFHPNFALPPGTAALGFVKSPCSFGLAVDYEAVSGCLNPVEKGNFIPQSVNIFKGNSSCL